MKTLQQGNKYGEIYRNYLKTNPSNIDCLISEHGWQAWFLSLLSDFHDSNATKVNEAMLIRSIFYVVHYHCIFSVKVRWRNVKQTVNLLLLHLEQGQISRRVLMNELLDNLIP